jgi:hypothetical protein
MEFFMGYAIETEYYTEAVTKERFGEGFITI